MFLFLCSLLQPLSAVLFVGVKQNRMNLGEIMFKKKLKKVANYDDELRPMLEDETWLSSEDVIKWGFEEKDFSSNVSNALKKIQEEMRADSEFNSLWSDITRNSERIKIATERYYSGDISFLDMLEAIAEEVMEVEDVPEEKQEE